MKRKPTTKHVRKVIRRRRVAELLDPIPGVEEYRVVAGALVLIRHETEGPWHVGHGPCVIYCDIQQTNARFLGFHKWRGGGNWYLIQDHDIRRVKHEAR